MLSIAVYTLAARSVFTTDSPAGFLVAGTILVAWLPLYVAR